MEEKVTLMTKMEHKLALRLVVLGATDRRWLWNALCSLSPNLAWLTAALSEIYHENNMIYWTYDPDDNDTSGVMEAIAENIDRAPTPLGVDRFVVLVQQLTALPQESGEISLERAAASIKYRCVIRSWDLRGDRWHDWKKGSSKQELLAILQQAVPTPEAPVTLVRAAVLGAAFARIQARLGTI